MHSNWNPYRVYPYPYPIFVDYLIEGHICKDVIVKCMNTYYVLKNEEHYNMGS
jgi:hypothetical protein